MDPRDRDPLAYRDLRVPPGFVEYNPQSGGWFDHPIEVHGSPLRSADHARRALSLRALSGDLSGLAQLPPDGLWKLVCRGAAVTDEQFDAVARFPLLEELDLEHTHITDRALAAMHTMQQLRTLSLASCAVTDAGVEHIAGLRALEDLNIVGTAISDDGLPALAHHPNLRVLNIRATRITGESLAPLLTMPCLRRISMDHKQHRHARRFSGERPEVEILS